MLSASEHCQLLRAERDLAERLGRMEARRTCRHSVLERDCDACNAAQSHGDLTPDEASLTKIRRELERVARRLDGDLRARGERCQDPQFLGRWQD